MFFRLSICALVAKIQPVEVVRWCPDIDFWRLFCVLYLQRAASSTFQTCILNSHQGHAMCRSTVDIQSAAAEIRRGKKKIDIEDRRQKSQGKNRPIMVCPITQGDQYESRMTRQFQPRTVRTVKCRECHSAQFAHPVQCLLAILLRRRQYDMGRNICKGAARLKS